ncbi:alpha/beta fold hydrolase [Mucilaginibacter sp. AK015]|uniref:alpha/beta fold hydrolase n=1 Tax=Mucilaginibacter sp. AK015 TaxID=2723072 RepID=UPI001620833F|nr:alpha/beta hydrolase [Mucilaginibacter sp. AK015]MBB5397435.1 pimeloyl-ACP methyl ester carboxylesterase [Mucilaginibacter sp. AK015]
MKYIKLLIFSITIMATTLSEAQTTGNYANVNGIKMYYEVQGAGSPLVLIHGGGSTIKTNFSRIMPQLAKTHKVIAVELQAHGHTGDRNAPETFTQDADDIAELLKQLNIPKADFLGFSNGGQTCLELGLRHAGKVGKLIIASAFYTRDAAPEGFWKGFENPNFSHMPQIYKDEYLKIGTQHGLMNMFNKDVQRMLNFKGWTDEQLKSIQAPAFVIIGDRDLPAPEHAAKMARTLPHGRLAILPGTHGSYIGEAFDPKPESKIPDLFVAMVNEFLAGEL